MQVSNHLELVKPNPKDDREKQLKDEEFATAALAEDALLLGGVKQDESFLGLSDAQHCGKMQTLEILLADWLCQGDKVLLFSYSVKCVPLFPQCRCFMYSCTFSAGKCGGESLIYCIKLINVLLADLLCTGCSF